MRTKAPDTISLTEVESGLAAKVIRDVGEANVALQDFDDACQAAGRSLMEFFLQIVDRETFKSTVKASLGNGKFNEEFFLDGFRDAITKKYGRQRMISLD